jgi:hypothetical protein
MTFKFANSFDLEPGDLVEIKYRLWRRDDGGDELVDKWLRAEIIECEPGAWPLARLADGQLTEIRRFMTWRHVRRAAERRIAA